MSFDRAGAKLEACCNEHIRYGRLDCFIRIRQLTNVLSPKEEYVRSSSRKKVVSGGEGVPTVARRIF